MPPLHCLHRLAVALAFVGLALAPLAATDQPLAATDQPPPAPAGQRPMQIEDLFRLKRIADPQISPDGKLVCYTLTTVDLQENKSSAALWLAATDGKIPPRPLTDPKGKRDTHARWSPDGKTLAFESTRSGTSQIWLVGVEGGEPRQLTSLSTGASNPTWSPDGKLIAFVSAVYPEFSEKPFAESDKLNKEKDEAIEKSPVKAKVFTRLFFRHWDSYVGDKRQHLFVVPAAGGEPRDVTPGDRDAYPTSTTFSSSIDFTFSPDSSHLIFTAVPERDEAWSTNYDLCRVSVSNRATKWQTLTKANPAADSGPQFVAQGKKLAWRSQQKAGYEADRWQITVADCDASGNLTAEPKVLTLRRDLSVNEFAYRADLDAFVFTADYQGTTPIFIVDSQGKDRPEEYVRGGMLGALTIHPASGYLAYTRSTIDAPNEVYGIAAKGEPIHLSRANDALLAQLERTRPESVEVPVEGGVKMQMWLLKPPGFDPKKKYPVAYLVHGGPQGAWEDGWSWRWNPQLWAAQGYLVALPNPRGSTGFGQRFTDEISGDWGGKCYRDLVAGVEYVEKLPYVDAQRMGAAGASFGGYMMNWFAVNDIARKFKCLITHCSVWNFESMWGTTDELWFDEYEHGGLPWEVPHKYREFSPHTRAGELAKHRVPMLIIHNDLDFRCPIGQGHELFSTLQRLRVPARFVNFPDEGHWVLKPRNSQYWHQEVFGWLTKHVPPGGR